ncbi:hypothetical protein AVEN_183813-1, partial [Araneus ventricosus]
PFFGSDFHAWKEQRRFVVQSMKDLGLGKTKIEEEIMEMKADCDDFIPPFESRSSVHLNLKRIVQHIK